MTKALHWSTAAAITAQFVIGYQLDISGRGRGRGRSRGGGSGRGRGRGGDTDFGDLFGDDALFTAHVVLGATILTLAIVRSVWRLATPLPPWAATLSRPERVVAHWTERALYVLMFAIPVTGIWLVTAGDDDILIAHITAHVAFFVVIAFHVGLVLKHQLVDHDQLVRRMT